MRQLTVICDWCGIRKGDSNHWWKVAYEGNNLTILPFTEEDKIPDRDRLDLCSHNCVMHEVSRYLEGIIGLRRFEIAPLTSVTESTGEDQQSSQ